MDPLFSSVHKEIPAFSSALQVRESVKKGRYVVATKNIPAGSLLIREKSYATAIFDDLYGVICTACLKVIQKDTQVACEKCDRKYCSSKCLDKESKLHGFICGDLDSTLLALPFSLRLTIKCILDTTPQALTQYIKHDIDGVYDERLRALLRMVSHEYLLPPPAVECIDEMSQVAGKLVVKSNMLENGFFPKFSDVEVRQQTMVDLSRLITLGLICNKNAIGLQLEDLYGNEPKEVITHDGYVATGIFPSWCLLNHSCDNNIHVVYLEGGVLEARAFRDIKAGEEITNCYGPRASLASRHDRRNVLREKYYFECDCVACTDEQRHVYVIRERAAEEMLIMDKPKVAQAEQFAKKLAGDENMSTDDVMKGIAYAKTIYGSQHRALQKMYDSAAKKLIKNKSYTQAMTVLQARLASVVAQEGTNNLNLARIMLQMGGVYGKLGKKDMSIGCVKTATVIYVHHLGKKSARKTLELSGLVI